MRKNGASFDTSLTPSIDIEKPTRILRQICAAPKRCAIAITYAKVFDDISWQNPSHAADTG
ncbi:MAG: hypothetical protein ABSA39_08480 [Edaphobacter sp.]